MATEHPVLAHFTTQYHHGPYPAISPSLPGLSTAGKAVVVTGAAGGIGSAMCRAFVEAGTKHLVMIDLNQTGLLTLKAELEDLSLGRTRIHPLVVDITSPKAVRDAFTTIEAVVGGKLDVLVNNAGYQNVGRPVLDIDMDEWFRCFEINVKGSFLVAVEFLRHGKSDAIIINLSSILAHYGVRAGHCRGHSGYCASKIAITKAMDVIQEEMPLVRIVNLHPGLIATAMSAKIGNTALSVDSVNLPAHFAIWLASPEAEFLKGRLVWANWDVDEMKSRKDEIIEKDLLRIELTGI
ncbi:hypothetical protein AYL99_04245 [Fonsecaea erecta]|uniref:Ketoreductase domain-containing protein n=1 Tax=Fonsecaea erecta TaxID=1367422 RepID=A0A178ZQW5_9EURO|nr:hypothetical protein AYL99_04245 [Fonsecaea erecta]OAP62042.1 hypothetical protein AYL99_04245 [Fonsecaea erecta]